jgi:hypothetical protein
VLQLKPQEVPHSLIYRRQHQYDGRGVERVIEKIRTEIKRSQEYSLI